MLGNFRLALRLLAKSRGFTLVAITTLAVTIGVNSAIFSLIDGALLRPAVPYKPKEVVGVFTASRDAKRTFRQFSYAEFLALRESNAVFSDLAAVNFNYVSLGRAAELQRSFAFMVSENYFRMMGVQPVAGRFFTADETRPNAGERVVVASHKLWQRSGGRPDFIGSTVLVNGRAHTVVGVSPEGFSGVSALVAPDIWLPLGLFAENTAAFGERSRTGDLADPKNYCVNLMGRMRPGVTIASAQTQLAALAASLAPLDATGSAPRDLVVAKPFGINTTPSDTGPLRLVGTLLLSMSGVVLLIGCLNLANMMLARGSARASEIAVRLALGATRSQIVRQLLMEGVVLATAGGVLGLLLSLWANSYLQNFFATEFASFNLTLTAELRPDFVVLAATFILCLLATLVFSLGPALRAARADLAHDLKGQAGDAAVVGRWNRFFSGRHLMVMGQIALCLVMLFAAGVFVRAAVKEGKQGAATGFSMDGVVIAELDFSLAATSQPEVLRRSLAAVERLRRMPGVETAALTSLVPYNSSIRTIRLVRAEEAPAVNGSGARPLGTVGIYSSITPGYFDSIGVRLLRGRDFTEAEARSAGATRVCIIDERMAEKLFPGEDALGRRVRYAEPTAGGAAGEMEVIGVVARHAHGMEDRARPAPGVYIPLAQEPNSVLFLAVRAAAWDRGALLETIGAYRRELQALDPELPILQMMTFAKFLQKNFTLRMVELGAMIFGVFGGIALLLASVGVYGVKAYAVERRTREIGIRIALGASRRDVFALIMKQGAEQTVVALSVGLGLSLLAGNALAALFFQVRPNDPFVLFLSAAILTGATMLACFVPARRATRVSPLSALRSE
jgi:predicted permease